MKIQYKKAFSVATFGAIACFVSCSGPATKLFTKRTPHEEYAHKLEQADLHTTALGIQWFKAGNAALNGPVAIEVPYRETGYFAAERPTAAGFSFPVKRGEKITIQVSMEPDTAFRLFADLFEASSNGAPAFLQAAEKDSIQFAQEVNKEGNYILRLQPELLKNGAYTLTITNGHSLSFPVDENASPRVGSFFGNSRDAGARTHEGIDIFAKKGTPAVAASNGLVTRVGENGLGGKVVFMRPSGRNFSLYYAHLDSQIAHTGQFVKTGDTLGLVGNTGNARNTPSHLHFGIYAPGGAIDPYPFVKQSKAKPAAVTASVERLNTYAYNTSSTVLQATPGMKSGSNSIPTQTAFRILAATENSFKVELPDGTIGFINASAAKSGKPSKTIIAKAPLILREQPIDGSAGKLLVEKNRELAIYGKYEGYQLVDVDGLFGWVKE